MLELLVQLALLVLLEQLVQLALLAMLELLELPVQRVQRGLPVPQASSNTTWIDTPAVGTHTYEIRITVTGTNIVSTTALTRALNAVLVG
jgi:hypothetical protein